MKLQGLEQREEDINKLLEVLEDKVKISAKEVVLTLKNIHNDMSEKTVSFLAFEILKKQIRDLEIKLDE